MSFHLDFVEKRRRAARERRSERYRVVALAAAGTLAGALLIGLGLPLLRALF